jgi:hypothetical protein
MKKFNYFHDGVAITKAHFEANVPENWQDDLDQYGEYSSGYFRAIGI